MSEDDHAFQDELDSLDRLPLCVVPLRHPRLRRARLIKNTRMEGVFELFSSAGTGSGQINLDHLKAAFQFGKEEDDDINLLRQLCDLPSYDIYSLRAALRIAGVDVDGLEHLQPAPELAEKLDENMTVFARPLVDRVFGPDADMPESFDGIVRMFAAPEGAAQRNLEALCGELGVEPADIAEFLVRYGDFFLCLSFYQRVLDLDMEVLGAFLADISFIENDKSCQAELGLASACAEIRMAMSDAAAMVASALDVFKARTQDLWAEVSAARFHEARDLVTGYHRRVAAALCVVDVKTRAWFEKFPTREDGTMYSRVNFIMSEVKPGLEKVAALSI